MSVLRFQIGGRGVEYLDIGRRPDETLQRVEHLGEVVVALGHHGHGDRRPLPEILVVDLGHRDVVAVPQGVDDRADGGALRLEGPALRHVQVKAQGSGMHAPILAAPEPQHERETPQHAGSAPGPTLCSPVCEGSWASPWQSAWPWSSPPRRPWERPAEGRAATAAAAAVAPPVAEAPVAPPTCPAGPGVIVVAIFM